MGFAVERDGLCLNFWMGVGTRQMNTPPHILAKVSEKQMRIGRPRCTGAWDPLHFLVDCREGSSTWGRVSGKSLGRRRRSCGYHEHSTN